MSKTYKIIACLCALALAMPLAAEEPVYTGASVHAERQKALADYNAHLIMHHMSECYVAVSQKLDPNVGFTSTTCDKVKVTKDPSILPLAAVQPGLNVIVIDVVPHAKKMTLLTTQAVDDEICQNINEEDDSFAQWTCEKGIVTAQFNLW